MISLIFDLDNTLVRCSEYYVEAYHKFADLACLRTGLHPDIALGILRAIDLESIKIDGFNRNRFPKSFAAASVAIDILTGLEPSTVAAKRAWRIGNSVFTAPYPLYEGTYNALTKIKAEGHPMFLCTKGDPQVQMRKICKNKLHKIFPDSHIYVDNTKGPDHFRKIIKNHKLDPAEVIAVGDSLKDDVGAALQVGIRSIHVTDGQITWAYENEAYVPTYSIHNITELPALLKSFDGTCPM